MPRRSGSGFAPRRDLRNEKINYKVREHSLAKVPVMLVAGKKEAAERTISIRRLGKEGQTGDAARRSAEGAGRRGDCRRMSDEERERCRSAWTGR